MTDADYEAGYRAGYRAAEAKLEAEWKETVRKIGELKKRHETFVLQANRDLDSLRRELKSCRLKGGIWN